jgi:hypothetical protein
MEKRNGQLLHDVDLSQESAEAGVGGESGIQCAQSLRKVRGSF